MRSPVPARPTPLRTLVVDADGVAREVLRRGLVDLGHEVVVCRTAEAAWAEYQMVRPDVVFADSMLPDLAATALCRRIRSIEDDGEACSYLVLTTGVAQAEHARAGMEAGADDFLRKPVTGAELEARLVAGRRVTALRSRLRAQEHDLVRLNDELAMVARTDPLTGLANRVRLDEDLATMQGRMARYGHQACMAVLDVDHFKRLNDAHGHAAGDDVLRKIAAIMRRTLRAGDVGYRHGGQEFVCLFPEIDATRGRSAADRIRHLVERAGIAHPGSPYGVVTVSVGIASSAGRPDAGIAELVGRAYRGLHAAKALGRNRVEVDPDDPLLFPCAAPVLGSQSR